MGNILISSTDLYRKLVGLQGYEVGRVCQVSVSKQKKKGIEEDERIQAKAQAVEWEITEDEKGVKIKWKDK